MWLEKKKFMEIPESLQILWRIVHAGDTLAAERRFTSGPNVLTAEAGQ